MTRIRRRKRAGFSAVELIAGISALVVVAGFTVVNMQGARLGIQANAALDQVVVQLQTARELAVAERCSYQILFRPLNQLQLRRLDVPSAFTDFRPASLGTTAEFTLFAGLPDTPQGFGNARAIHFGKTPTVAFASDGRLVDSAGQPVNGTIFLGIPDRPETARAVTIEGATGRITAYHWTGSAWEE